MYFTCFRRWVLGFIYRQACWLSVQSEVTWDRNYIAQWIHVTVALENWKVPWPWVMNRQVNEGGLFPPLPKFMPMFQAVLDVFVDRISRKLPEVITIYLHDRSNFSSAVNPSLGWDLGGKIVSHLEMPRGFPGTHLYLAWNGSSLFSLSPKLFMPETTDSFSIRPISWNLWGPGKHTTFPTPSTGGFGLDLWVLA